MRRSDLVGLDVTDVASTDEGLVVVVRRSKTDQLGAGRKVGIPFGEYQVTCPVRAVLDWVDEADIEDGPGFRAVNRHGLVSGERLCDRAVADIVKRSLRAAGFSAK